MIKKQWDAEIWLDYVFLKNSKNRIFAASKEVFTLSLDSMRVDSIGLYVGMQAGEMLRLSAEGAQIIGPHAKSNVMEITKEEQHMWLRGLDVPAESHAEGFILLRHAGVFVGCAKLREGMLLNFFPKSRRISAAQALS